MGDQSHSVEPATANEIAAALVEASVGYYNARGALLEAEAYLRGEKASGSERCLACYKGDLRAMVEADLRYWNGLTEGRKARVRAIVEATKGWSWPEATALSLAWPTLTEGTR